VLHPLVTRWGRSATEGHTLSGVLVSLGEQVPVDVVGEGVGMVPQAPGGHVGEPRADRRWRRGCAEGHGGGWDAGQRSPRSVANWCDTLPGSTGEPSGRAKTSPWSWEDRTREEFYGEFLDADRAAFATDDIDRALAKGIEPWTL